MDKNEIMEVDKQYYMPVFNRYPIVLSHGEGAYVFDVDGKKYLDFVAGIAVNIVGHGHKKLVAALCEQAGKMIHCSNLYYTKGQATLSQRLAKAAGMDRVFLANSGAEANEGAIKLARKYGKTIAENKIGIITASHSFHGRTLATLTATAQPKYQKGYEPLPGGFDYVPYNDLEAMKAMISDTTCAVLLEPIQGEGGIHVPDNSYLEGVKQLCKEHKALLIFDEIQTGMGRTGKMFAYQYTDIEPDIITIAKGLGGGVPIGAFATKEEIAGVFSPGDHGTTFGGNPLACAAGNAVLTIIEEENLLQNATVIGAFLQHRLNDLKQKYPALMVNVRGRGLMVGAELSIPGQEIVAKCMEAGLLINCTAGNVLRFVPPINIHTGHVNEMISILDQKISESL